MNASTHSSGVLRSHRGRPGGRAVILLGALVLLAATVSVRPAHAALGATGAWSPAADWSTQASPLTRAVHLALLPGKGTPHSRVLFWVSADSSAFYGREWAWNPGNEGCGSFPSGNFAPEIFVPSPGHDDLFCSGNVTLPSGELFIPGGTHAVTKLYGENQSRIFATPGDTTSGSWTNPGEMTEYRWYPTSTVLRDGRALVLSGSQHPLHKVFGGERNGAAPASPGGDSLYRFAPVVNGRWEEPPGSGFRWRRGVETRAAGSNPRPSSIGAAIGPDHTRATGLNSGPRRVRRARHSPKWNRRSRNGFAMV